MDNQDKAQSRDRLFLLDAMALAYRAHFAFISRPLVNSRGMDTSAIYGFALALIKLLEEEDPEHIAVVFDSTEEKTFRDLLFEAYKANRPPMPEPLQRGIPYIKKLVEAFDIPVVEIKGVEADDVIGTLARQAEKEGVDTIIVSPDKDFQQLLSDSVSVLRPAYRGEQFDLITEESFRETYGVEPLRFIDILALLGDASDNVPGVPGVGKKTAPKLIREYGSVEELLDRAGEIKGKRVREGLAENRDKALLSKQLVTILTDVEIGIDWHELKRTEPKEKELGDLLHELEFPTLIERIRRQADKIFHDGSRSNGQGAQVSFDFGANADFGVYDEESTDYRTIRTLPALKELAAKLKSQKRFAFDTETTSREAMWAGLVGCSFSWEASSAYYVPVPLPDGTTAVEILEFLAPALTDESITKVGQNLKYDILVLEKHGVQVKGPLFDTLIAHYLIEPEEPHDLDSIARKYLKYQPIPISDLIGSGKEQLSMRDIDIDKVCPYACEDADISLRLSEVLHVELENDGLLPIAEQMEFPLVHVLADIERAGVKIDTEILSDISAQLEVDMELLEAAIYNQSGCEFNIGSPKQLGEILFDTLKLKVVRKTSTGQPSTNERVLSELSTEHELPGLILDWRRLAKLKSTYVDTLGKLVHPETGRVHTSFNQAVTATGRLSSSGPNLQNIPIRSDSGREIRRAFVADDGFLFVTADYAQIELRIIASMSGDPDMRAAFTEGKDIHTDAAARVFGVDPDDVTRDMRRKAKEVNYGIPYGVSAFGLAQRLRIPVGEARKLIEQYHRSYPGVSRFLDSLVETARERGYAETLKGRRRYLPDIRSSNRMQRSFAERVAVNMPIQGSQADMTKLAMVHISRRMDAGGYGSRMILQVHDELVFEVAPEELDSMKDIIHHEMANALPLDVPVDVQIGSGDNWLDAH